MQSININEYPSEFGKNIKLASNANHLDFSNRKFLNEEEIIFEEKEDKELISALNAEKVKPEKVIELAIIPSKSNFLFSIHDLKNDNEPRHSVILSPMNGMKSSSRLSQSYRRISNLVRSLISTKINHQTKFMIVFTKFLMPHFVAIGMSLLIMLVQKSVKITCFCESACPCGNSFFIKLYTLVKHMFLYWALIVVLVNSFFSLLKEIYPLYWINYIWTLWAVYSGSIIYLQEDGNQEAPPYLDCIFYGDVGAFVILLIILSKLNWNFKMFLKKMIYQIVFLGVLSLNRALSRKWFEAFMADLIKYSKENASDIFSVISFFYLNIFEYVIVYLLHKIYAVMKREEYPGIEPLVVLIRFILCFVISSQISNILTKDIFSPSFRLTDYLMFAYHIMFICAFYAGENPIVFILEKIIIKFTKRLNFIFEKSNDIILINKLMAGYMLDFQMILISKLIMLKVSNRWINSHYARYYSDCEYRLSNNYQPQTFTIVVLTLVNLFLPTMYFIYMYKNKKILFWYKVEDRGLLYRSYIILLFHCFLERTLQDSYLLSYTAEEK